MGPEKRGTARQWLLVAWATLMVAAIVVLGFVRLPLTELREPGWFPGRPDRAVPEGLDAGEDVPDVQEPRRGLASSVQVEDVAHRAADESPVRVVRVLVVDLDERPVEGMLVTVAAPRTDDTFAVGRTDARGEVELTIEAPGLEPGVMMRVGTAWVGTTPPPVTFSLENPPSDPIRFVLEPHGSIEVVLVGGHDLEFYDEDQCQLHLEDQDCGSQVLEGIHATYGYGTFVDRVAVFPRVRLDACFSADARLGSHRFEIVRFDGPRLAGERVRVEVPLREAYARLEGRVVATTGEVLRNCTVEFSRIGHWEPDTSTTTDAEGIFREYSAPSSRPTPKTPMLARAIRTGSSSFSGQITWPEASGTWGSDGGERIEFGTIALSPEPLLAAGRVVDARGRPTRATIELRPTAPWRSESWTSVGESTEEGLFRISVQHPVEQCELRATALGESPGDAVAVTAGADGVQLVLGHSTRVRGRVLLPEGVSLDTLEMSFRCVDHPDESEYQVRGWETFEEGEFQVQGLLPARYRMTLFLHDHELAVREFTVPAMGCRIELEAVDLRERLHVLEITLVTNGAPDGGGASGCVVHEEECVGSFDFTRSGRAMLVSEDRVVDIVVSKSGFRTRRFDGIADGARIDLEPGLPTTLRLEPWSPLPEGFVLKVLLWADGSTALASRVWLHDVELAADGTVRLELPYAGEYRVRFRLHGPGNDVREWRGETTAFTRSESRAHVELVVPYDAARCARELESMRR